MFRQAYPNPSQEDLIFTYKYLGVIYAASESTRKKGKSYMVQLVKLMPDIELVDLYISEDIQAIFKYVKEDFLKQRKYAREHNAYGHRVDSLSPGNIKDTAHSVPPKSKSSRKWVWWTAGGFGAAAAATGTLLYLNEHQSKDQTRIRIPF